MELKTKEITLSHFYASIPASARKTVPTARGHKSTGVTTLACSWNGAIEVRVWYDAKTENDVFEVSMVSHKGSGETRCIGSGIVGLADSYISCGAPSNEHINFGDVYTTMHRSAARQYEAEPYVK